MTIKGLRGRGRGGGGGIISVNGWEGMSMGIGDGVEVLGQATVGAGSEVSR